MKVNILPQLTYVLLLSVNLTISAQDDSTLYVKTLYQHEIFNGRNSARKIAIQQEMRNSEKELFRNVYYNFETKRVDSILYYFYNPDQTINHIEKAQENESIIEYRKYSYKKKKLSKTEYFTYNNSTLKSTPIKTITYKHKKNKTSYASFTPLKEKLEEGVINFNDNAKLSYSETTDYNSDSTYKKITQNYFKNNLISNSIDITISKNSDSTTIYHEYLYNSLEQLEKINTYNNFKKEELLYVTFFKYLPRGSLQNKYKITKDNFYLNNISYKFDKYYRELPTRKPLF